LFGLSLPEFGSRIFNERGVPFTWKSGSEATPEITGNKENKEGSSSAEQEWGQEYGPLVQNPNFAPTPWRRFEWGNAVEEEGPEPEPASWGRSRLSRRGGPPSPSSSRSHSPDQGEKKKKDQEAKKAMEKKLQAMGKMKVNLREA
jgi:hypothetical protein